MPHGNLTNPLDVADMKKQLRLYLAEAETISTACKDPEGAGRYMSTAHVVRDVE
jgi:hypothetical protein